MKAVTLPSLVSPIRIPRLKPGLVFSSDCESATLYRVLFVDEHAARPPKLLPLRDKVAVFVENLDAVVGTISNIEPAGGIECNAMCHVELAGPGAVLAPRLDEFPVFRQFDNPIIGRLA